MRPVTDSQAQGTRFRRVVRISPGRVGRRCRSRRRCRGCSQRAASTSSDRVRIALRRVILPQDKSRKRDADAAAAETSDGATRSAQSTETSKSILAVTPSGHRKNCPRQPEPVQSISGRQSAGARPSAADSRTQGFSAGFFPGQSRRFAATRPGLPQGTTWRTLRRHIGACHGRRGRPRASPRRRTWTGAAHDGASCRPCSSLRRPVLEGENEAFCASPARLWQQEGGRGLACPQRHPRRMARRRAPRRLTN